MLSQLTTKLADPKQKASRDKGSDSDSVTMLDSLSKSTLGVTEDNLHNTDDRMDTSMLDQNIINALEDNSIRIDLDTDNTEYGNEEEYVSVGVTNVKTTKLNKTGIHLSAVKNVIGDGIDNMKKINLPVVRHCRIKRLRRER